MSRELVVGAAQLGPIMRSERRSAVVDRLLRLLHQAHEHRVELLVYPELALTTFFPRWNLDRQDEIDSFFERAMPNDATRPLFEEAKKLGIGFSLGYAELTPDDGAWYLRDLESANGTYLNGQRIMDRIALSPGDQIRCGSSVFLFTARAEDRRSQMVHVVAPEVLEVTVEHTVDVNEGSVTRTSMGTRPLVSLTA